MSSTQFKMRSSYGLETSGKCMSLRCGSMMIEMVIGTALLAALLVIVSQVIVRLQTQTKAVDKHFVAQQTLENLLEEFTAQDWQEITNASVTDLKLPEWVKSKLQQAVLTGEIAEEVEPVAAKRITLRFSWQGASGKQRRPLSLTTWVYRHAEDAR